MCRSSTEVEGMVVVVVLVVLAVKLALEDLVPITTRERKAGMVVLVAQVGLAVTVAVAAVVQP